MFVSSVGRFALGTLVGCLLFIGLPLLSWGIADIQGFLSLPARLVYVMLVILLQVSVMVVFPGIGRVGGKGKKMLRRQQLVVVLMQTLSLAIIIAAPLDDRRALAILGDSDTIRYLGLLLFAVGFTGMNWAEASLGKQFSVQVAIQEDHQLITDGIYHYLRHPRYLSIIVFNVGIALVFRSGLSLMLVVVLTLVLLWRIRDEEAFMQQEFGAVWDAYSRRSRRLIPFVF